MRVQSKLRSLTLRFGVKAWIAPSRLIEIAQERTEGMVSAFVATGAKADRLANLAQSYYMQGLNDAIDSLTQNPAILHELAGNADKLSH